MRRYEVNAYVECVHRYKISETTMVTPIVLNMLSLSPERQAMLDSLRFIWCGGAPLSAELQNHMSDILHPDAIVAQVWGMTEIGWITTMHFPEKDDTGSVGRLLPNFEAK